MSRKMRRKIRSYIVFTSLPYRIIVYFALPVVVAATGFWAGTQGIGDGGVMFAAVLLPLAEIISDNWLFNGIQSRDMAKMDYLKTSGRGMAVMRDALVMDLLRKFLTAAGSMALCAAAIELWKAGGMPGAWAAWRERASLREIFPVLWDGFTGWGYFSILCCCPGFSRYWGRFSPDMRVWSGSICS